MVIKVQTGISTSGAKKLINVKNITVENQYYVQRAKEAVERRESRTTKTTRGGKQISEELELAIAKDLMHGLMTYSQLRAKHNVSHSVILRIESNVWIRKYDKPLGVKR